MVPHIKNICTCKKLKSNTVVRVHWKDFGNCSIVLWTVIGLYLHPFYCYV
jgi:hypothetical protein